METTRPIPSLQEAIATSIDVIDRKLAREGVPLHARAMPAAANLVDFCILKIDEAGDGEGVPPGDFKDYATSKWFKVIYREVERWYRDRFGDAMDVGRSNDRDAVTLIRDTPYLLRVPMTTSEPGIPGESAWLCFHDAVQPSEDVLKWIENGPVFANLEPRDVKSAYRITEDVATKLRSIHIALLGTDRSDAKVAELCDGILLNLERAARHLAKAGIEDVKLAHWDMQMACELALKCLAQQRANDFKETHDLFYLYDSMPEGVPPFPRTELSKLPNWEKMMDLRYGGGAAIPIPQAFRAFRAALTVVTGTAKSLRVRYRLGKAKLHLKRPPWMEES